MIEAVPECASSTIGAAILQGTSMGAGTVNAAALTLNARQAGIAHVHPQAATAEVTILGSSERSGFPAWYANRFSASSHREASLRAPRKLVDATCSRSQPTAIMPMKY